LVHVDVYDRVVGAIAKAAAAIRVGDPRLPETQIGPVANRAHYERIRAAIVAAEGAGTEILVGGSAAIETSSTGLFVAPTVFSNVDPMSDLSQNEIFGPVLSCIPFTTEDEAIAIANSTAFGLASGIWTKDLSRAHRLARRIEAGTVWINTYRTSGTQAPFGGKKLSGYGRERGVEAIEEYLTTKNVMIDLSDSARDPFAISV
jgi:acyl-CoA reductase-like NAD-dependent aldehyde dehydrogenase